MSGNEPSRLAAGLHTAADSSVVVCLGGHALQLRARFPKTGCSVYSWYSSRQTAGMKTTMPCPLPQTRPRIQPMKPKIITVKLGVGAAEPLEPFERTSLHQCVRQLRGDLKKTWKLLLDF